MKISMPALAGALGLAAAQQPAASNSICPFNYPSELNTTTVRSGLRFHISSNNPLHNNRAVQLRADPQHPGRYLGGVDAGSPVLLANLDGGSVRSEAQDWSNTLYGLGAAAYLEQLDTSADGTRFTFGFANATARPDREWTLTGASEFGWYGLYHAAPLEVSHGFIICQAGADGARPDDAGSAWWQLFYVHNGPEPVDFAGCEYVGVSTTVPAEIYNGECNIGGYYPE